MSVKIDNQTKSGDYQSRLKREYFERIQAELVKELNLKQCLSSS